MTISSLLYGALSSDSGITTLVSTRIYPLKLPQDTPYPAVSYQRISNTGEQGSTALKETRYQLNAWADTYASAQTLATAIKTALEEHKDTDQTPGIKMARVVNELDDYDPDEEVYRIILDVIMVTTGD